MAIHVGDFRKVQTLFRDAAGVPAHPTATESTCRHPDGTVAAVSNANITASSFTLDDGTVLTNVPVVEATLPVFDEPGVWEWAQVGTSGITEADQGLFVVEYAGARPLPAP